MKMPVLNAADKKFMDEMDGTFDDPKFVEKFIKNMDANKKKEKVKKARK